MGSYPFYIIEGVAGFRFQSEAGARYGDALLGHAEGA